MKTAIHERLKLILDRVGINQVQLGEKLSGRSRQNISNWANGIAPIPDEAIIEIIRLFPEINGTWFITGDGEIVNEYYEVNDPLVVYRRENERLSKDVEFFRSLISKKYDLPEEGTDKEKRVINVNEAKPERKVR